MADRVPRYFLLAGIVLIVALLVVATWAFRTSDSLNRVSVQLGPLFWLTPHHRKIGMGDIRLSDVAAFEVNVALKNRSGSTMDTSVWVDKMYTTGSNPAGDVSSLKDETSIWLRLGDFRYIQLPPNQERAITVASGTLSGSRLSDLLNGRMAFAFDGAWVVRNGGDKPRFLPFCGYFSGGDAFHRC
jgi:hypothetical protein